MLNSKPVSILLIKDGDTFWNHSLNADGAPVHVAFMDVTGKSLKDDYPIRPLIAGGGTDEEARNLLERAVKHANQYRADGHLEKDIHIARLERQHATNIPAALANK